MDSIYLVIDLSKRTTAEFSSFSLLQDYLNEREIYDYKNTLDYDNGLYMIMKESKLHFYGMDKFDVKEEDLCYIEYKDREVLIDMEKDEFYILKKDEKGSYRAKKLSVVTERQNGYEKKRITLDGIKVSINKLLQLIEADKNDKNGTN